MMDDGGSQGLGGMDIALLEKVINVISATAELR